MEYEGTIMCMCECCSGCRNNDWCTCGCGCCGSDQAIQQHSEKTGLLFYKSGAELAFGCKTFAPFIEYNDLENRYHEIFTKAKSFRPHL